MRLVEYAHDAAAEGMWHAAFVRSPHPHARVASLDASSLPPKCVALLPEDTAGLGRYGCQLKDQDVLADPARFVGDIVAAVAAPTPAAARAAAQALGVAYEELPAVFDPLAAVAEGAPLLHPAAGGSADDAVSIGVRPLAGTNVCHRFRLVQGDAERGFAEADVVRRGDVPHGGRPARADGAARDARKLDRGRPARAGDRHPDSLQPARRPRGVFGLDPERIRVIAPPMGGSFGAKTFTRLEAIVACLARKAGRPVKAVLERSGGVRDARPPPGGGAREGGRRAGRHARCEAARLLGGHRRLRRLRAGRRDQDGLRGRRPVPDTARARRLAGGLHEPAAQRRLPRLRATQSVWASERAMDLLAERLGISPLELRLRNLLRDGDRFATGETMHDVHFEECLRAAADAVGYEEDPRGKGLCVLLKGMQTPSRAAISVERTPVGYTIRSASCEMGQGVRDSLRLQGAALLGCEPGQIEVPTRTRTARRSTRARPRAARPT